MLKAGKGSSGMGDLPVIKESTGSDPQRLFAVVARRRERSLNDLLLVHKDHKWSMGIDLPVVGREKKGTPMNPGAAR